MAALSLVDRLRHAVGWGWAVNGSSPADAFHRRAGAAGRPEDGLNVTLDAGVKVELLLNASLAVGGSDPPPANYVRDTLWIVVPITVIYSLILVVGVLGNVTTCVVIWRNRSMHTATNYYLFSLAVSDLLLLVTGVPQEIYSCWYRYPYPFSENICIVANFVSEASVNATVLTITAFTVERYIAICKPFLSHTMSRLSRAVRFVLAIWTIALSLAVPQALAVHIEDQFSMCTVRHHQAKPFFFVSTLLVFIVPMSVITVLYVLIWLQLRRSTLIRSNSQWDSSVRLRPSRRTRHRSQRTVVTLNDERNQDCELGLTGSASALTASMVQPPAAQLSPPEARQPPPTSPPPTVSSSCPVTPERRRLLGGQWRRDRRAQPACRVASSSFSGPSSTAPPPSPAPLELQLSFGSDDGRINYSSRMQYNSTRHVVKMLVAVVIAFFLCWAPFHAQRLMAVYGNEHNGNAAIRRAYELLTYTSGIFYYVSTCINPVLYNIMSHKFRAAFQEMLANYYNLPPSHPLREDLFFRNVSRRSSVPNSRSLDTCSSLRRVTFGGGAGVRGANVRRQPRRPSAGNELPPPVRPAFRRIRSEETATPGGPGPEVLMMVLGRADGPRSLALAAVLARSEPARPQHFEPARPAVGSTTTTTTSPTDDDNEPTDRVSCLAGRNVPALRTSGARRQVRCRFDFEPQVLAGTGPDPAAVGGEAPDPGQL